MKRTEYEISIPVSIGERVLRGEITNVRLGVHANPNSWFPKPCYGPAAWAALVGVGAGRYWDLIDMDGRSVHVTSHISCVSCNGRPHRPYGLYQWVEWALGPHPHGLTDPHRFVNVDDIEREFPNIHVR